jgi:hypothetical protein
MPQVCLRARLLRRRDHLPPSALNSSKSLSTSSLGTSSPSIGIALRNSCFETLPSPFSSHSRNRSITRAAFFLSAVLRVAGMPSQVKGRAASIESAILAAHEQE